MMYMPLGFAVLCLAGCRQEQTDRRETLPPVKVKTMQVTTSTTAEEEHRYSGTIEETAGTPLSFPVMGTVSEVHFKVGDRVSIDNGPLEGFVGTIREINDETQRAKVSIVMFGRQQDVEVEYVQMQKISPDAVEVPREEE